MPVLANTLVQLSNTFNEWRIRFNEVVTFLTDGQSSIFPSVRAYGAVGDGVTNDTAAFNLALAAVANTGGVIIVPPGKYAVNFTIDRPKVTLTGFGIGRPSATSNSAGLVPFDPTLPTLTISSDTQLNEGVMVSDLEINGLGTGYYGMQLKGGCYNQFFNNITISNFQKKGLWIESGNTQPCAFLFFNNMGIQMAINSNVEHNILVAAGSANTYAEAIFFHGLRNSGVNFGHAVELKGSAGTYFINTWHQVNNNHGIHLSKPFSIIPRLNGGPCVIDSDTGSDILLSSDFVSGTNEMIESLVFGHVAIDGYANLNGTIQQNESSMHIPFLTKMVYPVVTGKLSITDPANPNSQNVGFSGNATSGHFDFTSNTLFIRAGTDLVTDLGSSGRRFKDIYANSIILSGGSIVNNFTVNGTLTVNGAATFKDTIFANAAITVNSTLLVQGATNQNNNLTVNGTLLVQGITTHNAAVTVNGTLLVQGVTTANANLTVNGRVGIGTTSPARDLVVSNTARAIIRVQADSGGVASNTASIEFFSNTIINWDITKTDGGDLKFNRYDSVGVFVDQPISLAVATGIVTIANTIDRTGGSTRILGSSSVVGASVNSLAGFNVANTFTVANSATFTNNVTFSNTILVQAAANINAALTVNGTALIQGALNQNNNATVNGTLLVQGATTVNNTLTTNGTLLIQGVTTANANLHVNGIVNAAVSSAGGLAVLAAGTGNAVVRIQSDSGGTVNASSIIQFYSNSIIRWDITKTSTHDLKINRYDSVGAFVDQPVSVAIATGIVTLLNEIDRSGGETRILGSASVVGATVNSLAGFNCANTLTVANTSTFTNGATFSNGVSVSNTAIVTGVSNGVVRIISDSGVTTNATSKVEFYSNTVLRWDIQKNSSHDFKVNRYDSSGVIVDQPVTIGIVDGSVTLNNAFLVFGTTTTNTTNIRGALTVNAAAEVNSTLLIQSVTTANANIVANGYITLKLGASTGTYRPDGLAFQNTTQANTGTNTDFQYQTLGPIPANALARNGDQVIIRAFVTFAAGANKTYIINAGHTAKGAAGFTGGVNVFANTSTANSTDVWVEAKVVRTAAGAQWYAGIAHNSLANTQSMLYATSALDETTAINVAVGVSDSGSGGNIISIRESEIIYIPAP